MSQGSILGPLTFLLDVNDLKSTLNLLDPIRFRDDTNFLLTHKNFSLKQQIFC